MARLLLTVGFDSKKSSATPSLVYLGRAGAEQIAAEQQSALPYFMRYNHVLGFPKHNPHAATNASVAQEEDGARGDFTAVPTPELLAMQDELKRLQQVAADRSVEIEKLKTDLAAALKGPKPPGK